MAESASTSDNVLAVGNVSQLALRTCWGKSISLPIVTSALTIRKTAKAA
nr:hypothetical protein [Desulfosporosinus orientis]